MSNFAFDQPDSLEGWVAIKENPFTDNVMPPRLTFHVCWNNVERKVAVTCRQRSRVASDTEEHLVRTGLFSFDELRCVHELLSLVHPSLGPYLPILPQEPRGLWAFVSYQETPENIDEICQQLGSYFPIALETCKEKLLMSTLFEENSAQEYFENISELRRQGYDQIISIAEEELKNVVFERENASNMSELGEIYAREDTAVFKLNVSLAELYNYQIQPFLDLREVAVSKVKEAKHGIQDPNVGDRVKREFADRLAEWQQHYEEALDRIQDIYIKYYSKTKSVYKAMLTRMMSDKKKFGKVSFELIGQERLFRIKEDLCLETLQYLTNVKKKYVQERDKVKEMIASVDEKPGVQREIMRLENEVYDWQIKIYELHMQILDEEEKLAKTQREAITRDIKDEEEQVVFYDAVEDTEQLSSEDEMPSMLLTDPRLRLLRDKMAGIHRRRAKLRTKKLRLERRFQDKEDRKQLEIDRFKQHHSIHMRRVAQKEELEEKQDFLQEQRKKTIDRLKTFKVKYPTPATIKPPRYQPPSQLKGPSKDQKGPASMPKTTVKSASKDSAVKSKAKTKKTEKSKVERKPVPKPRLSKDTVDGDDISVTIYVSGHPQSGDTSMDRPPSPVSAESSVSPTPPAPPPPPPAPPPPPPPPLPTAPTPQLGVALHRKDSNKQSSLEKFETQTGPPAKPDLQSIQSGLKNLKPAKEMPQQKPRVSTNPMDEIFGLIKSGVKLRSVTKETSSGESTTTDKERALITPSDQHMQLLKESMTRINKFTRESSPDSDSDDGEFDD